VFYGVWTLKTKSHSKGKTTNLGGILLGMPVYFFIIMNIFLLHVMYGQIHR